MLKACHVSMSLLNPSIFLRFQTSCIFKGSHHLKSKLNRYPRVGIIDIWAKTSDLMLGMGSSIRFFLITKLFNCSRKKSNQLHIKNSVKDQSMEHRPQQSFSITQWNICYAQRIRYATEKQEGKYKTTERNWADKSTAYKKTTIKICQK